MQLFGKEWMAVNEEVAIYLSFLIVITILINNSGGTVVTSFTEQKNKISASYNGSIILVVLDPDIAFYAGSILFVSIVIYGYKNYKYIKNINLWMKNETILLDLNALFGLLLIIVNLWFNNLNQFGYIAIYSLIFNIVIFQVFNLRKVVVFKEYKNYLTVNYMLLILGISIILKINNLIYMDYGNVSFLERIIISILFCFFFLRTLLINNLVVCMIPIIYSVNLTSIILFVWMRLFFFERIIHVDQFLKVTLSLPILFIYVLFVREVYKAIIMYIINRRKDLIVKQSDNLSSVLSGFYYYITLAFFFLKKIDTRPLYSLIMLVFILTTVNYFNISQFFLLNLYLLCMIFYIRISFTFVLNSPILFNSVVKKAEEMGSKNILYMMDSFRKSLEAAAEIAQKAAVEAAQRAASTTTAADSVGSVATSRGPGVYNTAQPPLSCDTKLPVIKEVLSKGDAGSSGKEGDFTRDVVLPTVGIIVTVGAAKLAHDSHRKEILEDRKHKAEDSIFDLKKQESELRKQNLSETNPEVVKENNALLNDMKDREAVLNTRVTNSSNEISEIDANSVFNISKNIVAVDVSENIFDNTGIDI